MLTAPARRVFALGTILACILAWMFHDPTAKAKTKPLPKAHHVRVLDFTKHCTHKAPVGLSGLIDDASREFGINPLALAVTVYEESGCDPNKKGAAGEVGVAQVRWEVWGPHLKEIGIISKKQLAQTKSNLRAAAHILHQIAQDADSAREAFRRYNGSGHAARAYADRQIRRYCDIWKPMGACLDWERRPRIRM